jgi:hypothetical protein
MFLLQSIKAAIKKKNTKRKIATSILFIPLQQHLPSIALLTTAKAPANK